MKWLIIHAAVARGLDLKVLVAATALAHGLDPGLFHAIIQVESRGNHRALSSTGDVGIAQISPDLANRYGWDSDRLRDDVEYNLDCAATFLEDLYEQYGEREPEIWYSRYHSQNPVLRFRYKLRVSRYL